MSKRSILLIVILSTAVLSFASSSSEYIGMGYMAIAALAGLASVAGSIVTTILAVRFFSGLRTEEVVVLAICIAGSPFAVSWALTTNHTPPNVHGLAILGFLLYALISVLCAAVTLLSAAVRALRRRSNEWRDCYFFGWAEGGSSSFSRR